MNNDYVGANIPKLGFGLMRLPMNKDDIDMEQSKQMIDQFMKEGFTYFDTAYPYINGKSEEAVPELLVNRYPRDSFQLASKMPTWLTKEYDDFQKYFDIQLERTQAQYFDYYLLHALDKEKADTMDKIGGWDFVKDMKAKGFIKHFGFSFHDTADVLEDILSKHPDSEFVQLQINYADWEDEKIQSRLCFEVASKYNIPIIIMEPVKGGGLASLPDAIRQKFLDVAPDASVASWAMRYAASIPQLVTVLSGMSTVAQMEDNIHTIKNFKPITSEENALIAEVVEALNKIETIPCTDCKYCVEDCPQKINIPGIFSAYNSYKTYNNLESAKGHYAWVTGNGGKAGDCIACGLCEGHCPQHIEIIDSLKELSEIF